MLVEISVREGAVDRKYTISIWTDGKPIRYIHTNKVIIKSKSGQATLGNKVKSVYWEAKWIMEKEDEVIVQVWG